MKKHTKLTAALAATGLALAASSATAATTILSEDWQNPSVANNLRLEATSNGGFTGWEFPSNNVFRLNHHANGAHPQDGLTPNQAVQFEWGNTYASYDTTHTWSASDVYQVTLNATESSWSSGSDRKTGIRIREVETGTVVYTAEVTLPEYDAAHSGAGNNWNANQLFTFDFDAGDFAGGNEGNTLEFGVANIDDATSNRGSFVDNINFTLVPEPTTTALLGLGGLALILRRRK
jgi:hypothetical protein